MGSALLSLIL